MVLHVLSSKFIRDLKCCGMRPYKLFEEFAGAVAGAYESKHQLHGGFPMPSIARSLSASHRCFIEVGLNKPYLVFGAPCGSISRTTLRLRCWQLRQRQTMLKSRVRHTDAVICPAGTSTFSVVPDLAIFRVPRVLFSSSTFLTRVRAPCRAWFPQG